MYDEIIVGQGLTGLLTAIWSREEGKQVALVSTGLGKIFQSAGVLDILPGEDSRFADLMEKYKLNACSRLTIYESCEKILSVNGTNWLPLSRKYRGTYNNNYRIG